MRIAVTGADGFLGWHTRCVLRATTGHEIVPITRSSWSSLTEVLATVDAVVHIAGVNRAGSDDEVVAGNVSLAEDVARAVRAGTGAPAVVYANSTQVGNGSPYAEGKERAANLLRQAAADSGSRFHDVRLPNLFGEHGVPGYNSFVATFVDAVIRGENPQIADRPIGLLHARDAAKALIEAAEGGPETTEPPATVTSVGGVWEALSRYHATYLPSGDIPERGSALEVDLFNSYRSALFPLHYPIALVPRTDQRGRLVETVRSHGSGGQTFTSTTVPGVTRGEHFHLSKLERFVVLDGEAVIRLRRLFSTKVYEFPVWGSVPVAIDMPALWLHNITNVGDGILTTLFWTDTLFDAEHPDTFPEPVGEGTETEVVG